MSGTVSESSLLPLPSLSRGIVRVVAGRDRGRSVGVDNRAIVVGTESSCDLVVRDRKVSARHLEVRLAPRGFLIKDLGSRNGTYLGTSRVGEVAVPPGAELRIGSTHLSVLGDDAPEGIEPIDATGFGELVGASLAIRRVYSVLLRAAASTAPLLIRGETGTGKHLAARSVHAQSPRSSGPFVVFDCAAGSPGHSALEHFGHVRGAFTGTDAADVDLARVADGGTLFIDEVGELPEVLQPALLRFFDNIQVRQAGQHRTAAADVRIIAATHRDLGAEVRAGRFREDLYYRLNVLAVDLPPLRSRREDIPMLIDAILRAEGVESGTVDGPNLQRAIAHSWPGNVRELENALRAAVAVRPAAGFDQLALEIEVAPEQSAAGSHASFRERKQRVIEQFERDFLQGLMEQHNGNLRAACRASGLERTQLKRLLAKHGLR